MSCRVRLEVFITIYIIYTGNIFWLQMIQSKSHVNDGKCIASERH